MKHDPAAVCRFFSAEDACRIALQAYYAAARQLEPPAGEPWMMEGQPFATPTDFAEAFSGELQARVGLLGLRRLGTFVAVESPWFLLELASRIEPEKIAPLLAKFRAETEAGIADFSGTKMHSLPSADNAVHNLATSQVDDHD